MRDLAHYILMIMVIILSDPIGCLTYSGLGYRRWFTIIECLPMTNTISKLIMAHEEAKAIQNMAVIEGMMTLYENGLVKVLQGITTLEEVLRVTSEA